MAGVKWTRNSSITRVRPFFGQLLARDHTGADWLPALLSAAGGHDSAELGLIDDALVACRSYKDRVLKASIWLPQCFEHSLAPTGRLLEWCLRHPDQLTWPTKGGKRETYGDDAMKGAAPSKMTRHPVRRPRRRRACGCCTRRASRGPRSSGGRSRASPRSIACCARRR